MRQRLDGRERTKRAGQPLMPPEVRPAMMLRWKMRKNKIVGTAAIAEAAMSRFSGGPPPYEACQMPTFRVPLVGVFPYSTSSGQRKSFQTATRLKIETTAMIGRDMGRMIRHRIISEDAPSTEAASTYSAGIESKNRLSRKMLNALATEGSQMAAGEPIRFRCRIGRFATVMYCGTSRTVDGIISVASISAKMSLPPAGRSFDSE